MSTTKMKISEQIQRFLGGGRTPTGQKVHIYEIRIAVEQVINKLLKTEYFQSNIALGETIPNGLVLATYDNIPVLPYKNVSQSTLPAYPVKLPLNLGVFMIFLTTDVTSVFIPLQQGDVAMLQKEPLISNLLGQIGYEVAGLQVMYNKDLTNGGTVTPLVTMRLAVLDITQYGDTDLLPIPSSMEWDVVTEVCRFYGVEPNPVKIIDGSKDNNTTTSNNQMMS
jgi:hypothetical protein